MSAGDELIRGDTDAAVDFLKRWAPAGLWVLSSEEGKGKLVTRTFAPNEEAKARRWINERQGKHNIYFSPNQPRGRVSKKTSKLDIGAVVTLHTECDPRKIADRGGIGLEEERELLRRKIEGYAIKPSIVTDSGGGFWGFWLLATPREIQAPSEGARRAWAARNGKNKASPEDAAELAAYEAQVDAAIETHTRAIAGALGADACFNIDRIARLPGTVNVPSDKKIGEKGQRRALARVVWAEWDRRYPLDAFPKMLGGAPAPQPATTDRREPAEWCRQVLADPLCNPDGEHDYQGHRARAAFAVCCELVRCGWHDDEIAAELTDPANGISAHVLKQKSPQRYVDKTIANARRAAAADLVRDNKGAVAEINKDHALVLVGDKAAVLRESAGGDFSILTVAAFRQWYCNRFVLVGQKPIGLGDFWLTHRDRRSYEGLIFAPGREVPGHFNLWRGLAVEPRPGGWPKFRAHLLDNLCGGDEELLGWVLGWFAEIVQHPERKSGTSLAVRGKQGTGKTIIGKTFGSLLGRHYTIIADPRFITGRFNAHLISCLLLHADEAFWAGDHAAEGRLKDLVTGEQHLVEFKGKEAIRVRNFVRLFVCGNPDWIVPAGMEERRFAVLEIGDAHMNDTAYFAAIEKEMDEGGREALLYDLLRLDLSTVPLREIPKTEALLDQKIASLTSEQGWWLDVLQSGRLPWGCGVAGECPAALLFDRYVAHASKSGARRRSIETRLGMFLKKVAPSLDRREGTYKGPTGKGEIGSVYRFPELKRCREDFAKMMRHEFKWGEPSEWLKEPEPKGAGSARADADAADRVAGPDGANAAAGRGVPPDVEERWAPAAGEEAQ